MFSRHVFKTSSRHLFKASSRCLQLNNFSSSKMSSRRPQDVLGDEKLLRWRRVEDVFKTCLEDVFKTSRRATNVCWEASLSNTRKESQTVLYKLAFLKKMKMCQENANVGVLNNVTLWLSQKRTPPWIIFFPLFPGSLFV